MVRTKLVKCNCYVCLLDDKNASDKPHKDIENGTWYCPTIQSKIQEDNSVPSDCPHALEHYIISSRRPTQI